MREKKRTCLPWWAKFIIHPVNFVVVELQYTVVKFAVLLTRTFNRVPLDIPSPPKKNPPDIKETHVSQFFEILRHFVDIQGK